MLHDIRDSGRMGTIQIRVIRRPEAAEEIKFLVMSRNQSRRIRYLSINVFSKLAFG
jgi:hypothetical protein